MDKLNKIYSEFIAEVPCESPVFSVGSTNADIMLIGEAPGREEVEQGCPFVGKAGKNLNAFLELSGIEREQLFITNAVKFRPYKTSAAGRRSNRPPTRAEIFACRKCLIKEIDLIKPKLIVTLGNTALFALTADSSLKIGSLHGEILLKDGFNIFPLYHPASVIYRRELAAVYESDVIKLGKIIKTI